MTDAIDIDDVREHPSDYVYEYHGIVYDHIRLFRYTRGRADRVHLSRTVDGKFQSCPSRPTMRQFMEDIIRGRIVPIKKHEEKTAFDQNRYATTLCVHFNSGVNIARKAIENLRTGCTPDTVGQAASAVAYLRGVHANLYILINSIDGCIQQGGLAELYETTMETKLQELDSAMKEATDELRRQQEEE